MRRITYPTAMPLHAPEKLEARARMLYQLQEELSARARQVSQRDQELVAENARLRRRSWQGLAAAAVLALTSVGVAALAFSRAPAHRIAPVPDSDIAAVPHESAPKVAPPSLSDKAQIKSALAPADCLEALGSLSVAHLYQSHLNIGLLADGVESKTYTIAEAEETLQPVLDLMAQVDARLAKIDKSNLDEEDRGAIRQIQAVSTLLRFQADALRAYWATSDMQQASDFQEARKASWQGLAKVMGLDR